MKRGISKTIIFLITAILFFSLFSCSPVVQNDAFATNVVGTIIAAQTLTALAPTSTPDFVSTLDGYAVLSADNVPGLKQFGRIIHSTVRSIDFDPSGNFLVETDTIGSSIIDLYTSNDSFRFLEYQDTPVTSKWSPDGSLIASCQTDLVIQFWDPQNGSSEGAVRSESVNNLVSFIDWSPDSHFLLSLSDDPFVHIWDVTKKELFSTIMNESGSAIISAAWSPDGKTIALGTENGDLLLYQFQTELLSKVISETNLPINNIEWSPNGKYLAYSDDDLIYFHEFAAGFVTQKFQYPESSITAFAWSPDAKIMAVGFVGNIFLVINVSRADILFSYTELIGPVTNILWSKDGKLILTNSIDGIQYWGIQK